MKTLNKIFTYWREDLFGKKSVPDYRREKNLAKLFNREFGLKSEGDKNKKNK